VSIEPALVDAVLDQVKTGRVSLTDTGIGAIKSENGADGDEPNTDRIETPFLQLVMTRLWDEELRGGSRVLRQETLARLGGAERIVRTHLDKTLGALPASERQAAAGMFHYLVTPSGTKIAHTARDLAEYTHTNEKQLTPVLEKMSASGIRILRPVAPPPDQLDAPTRYEIFHDVLAPAMLDWRRRYLQQRRTRIIGFGLGALAFGVLLVIGVLWFNLQRSQQQLTQKAQEAQNLSEAILSAPEPAGSVTAQPSLVAIRATAAAVGTSAAAVTCQGAPDITFTTSSASVGPGEPVYLQWSNPVRVTDVTIAPSPGKVRVSGSQLVELDETTTYVLTAVGCGGTVTRRVTINVVAPTVPPTATPVPASPTGVPPTATAPRPTATAVPPTATIEAPTTISAPPGVYVTGIRVDPPEPHAGNQITFYANFLNTMGSVQQYRLCVEIFTPDDLRRSKGITTCTNQDIPEGASELASTGWNQDRIGGCVLYLAYPIWEDQAKARTKFPRPEGGDIWQDFTLCP
jgi:hypothetical protein